jgi:cell division protein ZapA (FtsZ GTPase activity inhibitor)
MAEPGRVELTLLGQTLTVRSEADPDYLRSLAAFLEERVAVLRKGGVRDPMMALSLAALDITDELFRAREDKARDEGAVGARIGALLQLLEQVAPREAPTPKGPTRGT